MTAIQQLVRVGGGADGRSALEVLNLYRVSIGEPALTQAQFAEYLVGPVGLDFAAGGGAWNAGTAYPVRAAVTHQGSLWRALRPTTGDEPGVSPDDWALVLPGIDIALYDALLAAAESERAAADAARIGAETAQAGAAAQRAAAEAARDAAAVSAEVYANTTQGLAATAVGDQFHVVLGDVIARYRHDAGPVATEIARYPSATMVLTAVLGLTGQAGDAAAWTANAARDVPVNSSAFLIAPATNGGPVTLTVSAPSGPVEMPLRDNQGAPLAAGDLVANRLYLIRRGPLFANVIGVNTADRAAQALTLAVLTAASAVPVQGLFGQAGTGTAWTANAPRDIVDGGLFTFIAPATNTGAVELTVAAPSGPLTVALRDNGGLPLRAGDLVANRVYLARRGPFFANVLDVNSVATTRAQSVSAVLAPDFTRLRDWTGAASNGPPETADSPAASIGLRRVDGAPVIEMSDLSPADFVIIGTRDAAQARASARYRLTVEARLVDATALGSGQAQIQIMPLNAAFVATAPFTQAGINLTAAWQVFHVDYETGASPLPFFRARVYKVPGYTDATGKIQVRSLLVQDVTGESTLPTRVSALEKRVGARGAPAVAIAASVYSLPVPTTYVGRPPLIVDSNKWTPLQPLYQSARRRATASAPKYDLTYLADGSEVDILCEQSTSIFAGHGRVFYGRPGAHYATAAAGSVVRVQRLHTAYFCTVLTGPELVYSSGAGPIHEISILLGGQSNAGLFAQSGGIGGFHEGLRDPKWMTQGLLDVDAFWVRGATGGTAILRASVGAGTNWWYDEADGANGAPMLTCLAAIDAAVAAGQPVPERIIWWQGESDAPAMNSGTITPDRLQTGVLEIWDRIRAHLISHGASDPQLINIGLGAYDQLIYRRGVSQVRQAYQGALAARVWAHAGPESYDLPRGYGELHYTESGYHLVGRRLARVWANLFHGATYPLGPTVSGVALAGDQRTITLTFSANGSSLLMPVGETPGRASGGPAASINGAPFGFAVLAADGTPLQIAEAEVIGSAITLRTAADATGARVCFPGGYFPEGRAEDFVRDAQWDYLLSTRGMPLRNFTSGPLA